MKEPQGTQSGNNQGDWQLICPYNKLWLTINPNVFSIIFDLLNVRKDDIVGTRRQLVSSNSYIFIDSLALLHTCLGIKAKCVHISCTIRYQSSNNFIYRITKKLIFVFHCPFILKRESFKNVWLLWLWQMNIFHWIYDSPFFALDTVIWSKPEHFLIRDGLREDRCSIKCLLKVYKNGLVNGNHKL